MSGEHSSHASLASSEAQRPVQEFPHCEIPSLPHPSSHGRSIPQETRSMTMLPEWPCYSSGQQALNQAVPILQCSCRLCRVWGTDPYAAVCRRHRKAWYLSWVLAKGWFCPSDLTSSARSSSSILWTPSILGTSSIYGISSILGTTSIWNWTYTFPRWTASSAPINGLAGGRTRQIGQ